jgi:hypothetical protein
VPNEKWGDSILNGRDGLGDGNQGRVVLLVALALIFDDAAMMDNQINITAMEKD